MYPIRKKSLGQHFLKDKAYAQKFTENIPLDYLVIEIGPGRGAITQFINNSAILIEKDRNLIPFLQEHFPQHTILEKDASLFNFGTYKNNIFVVSNLPFNVATHILHNLIKYPNIKEMVLSFQEEVARKIIAKSGYRNYGSLTVFTDNIFEKKYLFTIPPGAFTPQPAVNTGVIKFIRKDTHLINPELLNKILKYAFSSPRKKVHNNLKPLNKNIKEILEQCNIEQNRRPNELSLEDYKCIGENI